MVPQSSPGLVLKVPGIRIAWFSVINMASVDGIGFGSKHWTKNTQNNQHWTQTHFALFFFPNAIASPQQKWSRQHHRSKNPKIPAEQWQNRNNCNSKYVNFAPTKKNDTGFLPSSPNPPQFGASVVQDQRGNKQMTGFWLEDWHLSSMCFHSLSKVRLRGLNVACLSCIELGDLVEFVTQTNVYLLEPLRAISNIRQSLWLLILDLIILVLLIKILIELCRKIGVTSTKLPSRLVSRFGISHPHHLHSPLLVQGDPQCIDDLDVPNTPCLNANPNHQELVG